MRRLPAVASALALACVLGPAGADVYVEPQELEIQDGLDRMRLRQSRGDERGALQELLTLVEEYPRGLCLPPGQSEYVPLVEYVQAAVAAASPEVLAWYRGQVRGASERAIAGVRAGTLPLEDLQRAADLYRFSDAGPALLEAWAERCWERGWLLQAVRAWRLLASHPGAPAPLQERCAFRAGMAAAIAGREEPPPVPDTLDPLSSPAADLPAQFRGTSATPSAIDWLRPGGGDDGTRLMDGSIRLAAEGYRWRSTADRQEPPSAPSFLNVGRGFGFDPESVPGAVGHLLPGSQAIVIGGHLVTSNGRGVRAIDLWQGKLLCHPYVVGGTGGAPLPGGWVHGLASDGERIAFIARTPRMQGQMAAYGTGRLVCVRIVGQQGERGIVYEVSPQWEGEVPEAGTGHSFEGVPVVTSSAVYCASMEDQGRVLLHAFASADGRHLWSRFLCQAQQQPGMMGGQPSLALSEGILYVATHRQVVAAVDAVTGRPLWVSVYEPTGGAWAGLPSHAGGVIVRDGLVYAAPADSSEILCLDAATGRKRWGWTAPPARDPANPGPLPGPCLLIGLVDRFLYTLVTPIEGTAAPWICALDVTRPATSSASPYASLGNNVRVTGRPALTRGRLLVPASTGVLTFSIEDARGMPSMSRRLPDLEPPPIPTWPEDVEGIPAAPGGATIPFQGGNLVVVPGAIVVSADGHILCYATVEDLEAHHRAEIERHPDEPRSYAGLATWLGRREMHEEAAAILRQGIERVPAAARPVLESALGTALLRRADALGGDPQSAAAVRSLLDEALRLRPGDMEIAQRLAAVHESEGRPRDAAAILRGLIAAADLPVSREEGGAQRRTRALLSDRLARLAASGDGADLWRREAREALLAAASDAAAPREADGVGYLPAALVEAHPVLWSDLDLLQEGARGFDRAGRSDLSRRLRWEAAMRGRSPRVAAWGREGIEPSEEVHPFDGRPWAERGRPAAVAWSTPTERPLHLVPLLGLEPGRGVVSSNGAVSVVDPFPAGSDAVVSWAVRGPRGVWTGGGARARCLTRGIDLSWGQAPAPDRALRALSGVECVRDDPPAWPRFPEVVCDDPPGRVFVLEGAGTAMPSLAAVDLLAGDWLWTRDVRGALGVTRAPSGGIAVWRAAPDGVLVLDPRSGAVVREIPPPGGGEWRTGPAVLPDGSVAAATSSGVWRADLEAGEWTLLHRFDAALALDARFALLGGADSLWVVGPASSVRIPTAGGEAETLPIPPLTRLHAAHRSGDRLLRVGERDGRVVVEAHDPARRLGIAWRREFPAEQGLRDVVATPDGAVVTESGRGFFQQDPRNHLIGIDAAEGNLRWMVPLEPYAGGVRAIVHVPGAGGAGGADGGRLYVQAQGAILCLAPGPTPGKEPPGGGGR